MMPSVFLALIILSGIVGIVAVLREKYDGTEVDTLQASDFTIVEAND